MTNKKVLVSFHKNMPRKWLVPAERIYTVNEHGQVLMETIGTTKMNRPRRRKERPGRFERPVFPASYKMGFNQIVFMSSEPGGLLMRVKGGVHDTDFNFNRSVDRQEATLAFIKGMGYKAHKRRRGGWDVYIPTK